MLMVLHHKVYPLVKINNYNYCHRPVPASGNGSVAVNMADDFVQDGLRKARQGGWRGEAQ